MAQFLGFGNGSDGVITLSGTDAPIDSSCSGTAATRTLTVGSGLSFAAGQIVYIHQSRGTGVGNWEVAVVESYSGTTLTLNSNLDNTYTDSGSSQAQVLEMKQYSQVTISGTLTAKAWDENVGGIVAFVCNGKTSISGSITANGKGFLGGVTANPSSPGGDAHCGEGTSKARAAQDAANGNGGGGGEWDDTSKFEGGGGAGGGNGANGSNGGAGQGGNAGGTLGGTAGAANLTTIVFGGGGGKGAVDLGQGAGGNGGDGGGKVVIFSKIIEVTGTITTSGNNGVGGTNYGAGGGGGAGGSILIKADNAILGTTLLTALAGSGGAKGSQSLAAVGGAGGNGRIAIEACSRTGTTNPAATELIGGRSWCNSVAGMI